MLCLKEFCISPIIDIFLLCIIFYFLQYLKNFTVFILSFRIWYIWVNLPCGCLHLQSHQQRLFQFSLMYFKSFSPGRTLSIFRTHLIRSDPGRIISFFKSQSCHIIQPSHILSYTSHFQQKRLYKDMNHREKLQNSVQYFY